MSTAQEKFYYSTGKKKKKKKKVTRLYKRKNSRVKKALSFSTPKSKKLA